MTIGTSMDQKICLISWTGFSQVVLLEERTPDGYICGRGERLIKRQVTSWPDHSWPELWTKIGKNCQAEGEAKVVK